MCANQIFNGSPCLPQQVAERRCMSHTINGYLSVLQQKAAIGGDQLGGGVCVHRSLTLVHDIEQRSGESTVGGKSAWSYCSASSFANWKEPLQ